MAQVVDAYVAVGSNIAPAENIPRALDMLVQWTTVAGVSTFYRTAPIARPEQDEYRNGVFHLRASHPPRDLKFDVLRKIETALGRIRTDDAYAPRTIDLDLVIYGDCVVDSEELTLPDPDILTRPFVAVPLLEMAPALRLPDSGEPLARFVTEAMREELRADAKLSSSLKMRLGNE